MDLGLLVGGNHDPTGQRLATAQHHWVDSEAISVDQLFLESVCANRAPPATPMSLPDCCLSRAISSAGVPVASRELDHST